MAKCFNTAEVQGHSPTALEKDEMGWVSSSKGSFPDTSSLTVTVLRISPRRASEGIRILVWIARSSPKKSLKRITAISQPVLGLQLHIY